MPIKHNNLPSALIAVDLCIFKIMNDNLYIYVTNVENEMYKGKKALPGGLIRLDETGDDATRRVIQEKTELESAKIYKEQLYTFSGINRDKRSRVVASAYLCLYVGEQTEQFVPITQAKNLAYDHDLIVTTAVDRLQNKLEYTTIIQKAIQVKFTYSELQKAYEIILGKSLDKRNFRKKIDSLGIIKETGEHKKEGRMRPAMLYRFTSSSVENIKIFS